MARLRRLLGSKAVVLEEVNICTILAIVFLVPIWSVKFPPLQDYPGHLWRAHILLNYHASGFNYDKIFEVSLFPMPYIATDYCLMVLGLLFPLELAGKIILSVYIILLPASVFYLIYAVDKSKIILGFFGFLFIYNWYFNKGHTHFVFSIPLFLFTVGKGPTAK